MKQYIFLTDEGYTESPENDLVENLQVVGFSIGETELLAKRNLLKEHTWITDVGFDIEQIYGYELAAIL
jgi:hypothetical protein